MNRFLYVPSTLRSTFDYTNQNRRGRTMGTNKKTCTPCKAFFILTALMFFAISVSAADRDPWWWQEEIAPPPDGQIINPDFISKRDELERFWTQTNRDRGLTKQYFRWTNRTDVKYDNTGRGFRTATRLENELEKTPVYVPRPSDSGRSSAAPAQK